MAVHNEHSLRSFPNFCDGENFEDDDNDGENHFVISLDDSEDEDVQKSINLTPVCASVSPVIHTSHKGFINQETSAHMAIPCNIGVNNVYKISNSVLSSSACNRDISTYQQFIVSAVKNGTQADLQPNVYGTSKGNQQGSCQRSSTNVVCGPDSKFESRMNYQDEIAVTVSCSNSNYGPTFSIKCATDVKDPCNSLSDSASAQLVYSKCQNRELQDVSGHTCVTQQELRKSTSELPKRHLETIHLDKEAGGIWSEAVFLTSVGMSDRSFSDVGNDPSDKSSYKEADNNKVTHKTAPQLMTSNNSNWSSLNLPPNAYSSSCAPKLTSSNPRSNDIQPGTECSMSTQTNFAVENAYKQVLKMQRSDENATCTCIMCYKSEIVTGCLSSKNEDPTLTEEEKLFILKGPVKRKRLRSSAVDSKKKKSSLLNSCSIESKYGSVSTLSFKDSNNTKSDTSYLSDVKHVATAVHASHNRNILDWHNTNLTLQPKSLTSDVTGQTTLLVDMYNRNKSAPLESIVDDVSVGLKKPHIQYEIPTVTAASNVTSMDRSTPNMPHLVSAPRFRSNPTKVFLKPSEVPGLKYKTALSTPEISSNNKLCTTSSNNGGCSVQTLVFCKESQQTYNSPCAKLSSPPSYKIIYVSPDQVLVCPTQTSTSVNFTSVGKQLSTNTPHMTVLKLPQTNSQNKMLSSDARLRASISNMVAQNSQLGMNKSSNINPTNTVDSQNELRNVLKNAEKVDISRPGKVLINIKPSTSIQTPKQSVHTSQIITNIGAQPVTPTSKRSVCMMSLLKDLKSPLTKNIESTSPVSLSQASSVVSNPVTTTSQSCAGPPPSSLEVTKTLMSLIKSHFQEQAVTGSHNILGNLIKGGVQTLESKTISLLKSSHENIKVADSNISNKLPHMVVYKSTEDKHTPESPKWDKLQNMDIHVSQDKVSNPCLPQEGLPSTYVEDWVNQTKTYASAHLKESDCHLQSHNVSTYMSSETAVNHHKALISSFAENSKGHVHLPSEIKSDVNSSILETQNERETLVLPKPEAQSQIMSRKPCAHIEKQLYPNSTSDSACVSSNSSSTHISNICQTSTLTQFGQSPTSHMAREITQSFSSDKKSLALAPSSKKPSHSEATAECCPGALLSSTQSTCKSPIFSDQTKTFPFQTPETSSLSSSVINCSNGIKLKIKLNELRKDKSECIQSCNALDSSLKNGQSLTVPQSKDELFLLKRTNIDGKEAVLSEGEKPVNKSEDDKIETAEEMFQRFQKQAEQEVFKAQMGMGYLSRSLRPTRTSMAFIDKYTYRFGTGQPKKKVMSEDRILHVGSKKAGDNSNYSMSEAEQQSDNHEIQNKKPNMRNKRQTEETNGKELKVKHPKLSIKDYPQLKQDCSITNRKRLLCSNILAGHKVYVKFNTYENICSGRAFLVPFFNIGGTRTQFDVEDIKYINEAVLTFEKEERTCARHLLFYAREGQKAAFLRKETHFQTGQVNEQLYKKSSFILEGFRRDSIKQLDPSPEQWKVDNTVGIEIDRAEVDNDAEIEFDANTDNDEVNGLEVYVESLKENKIGCSIKHSEQERIKTKNIQSLHALESSPLPSHGSYSTYVKALNGPANYASFHCSQSSSATASANVGTIHLEGFTSHTEKGRTFDTRIERYGPNVSGSNPHSNEISVYAEQPQEVAPECQYKSTVGNNVAQTKNLSMCTILKKEMLDEESEIECSVSAKVKEEKPDDGYENIIKHPDSTQAPENSCSAYSSNNSEQLFDKCNIFVKKEPLDEYVDSSIAAHPCSSKSCQIEQTEPNIYILGSEHVRSVPESHIKSLSRTSVVQPKFVNGTSEQRIANVADQVPGCLAVNPHTSVLTGHIVESSIVNSHTLISKLQVADSTSSKLQPSLTNMDAESFTCGVVNESVSIRSTTITESSLLESPLPSSSMSESSDILASSDIDEKHVSIESGCSSASHTSLQIPELTPDDGNFGDKQNSIQNKITSLVESLRHRLTQDTSSLPPWLANTNKSEPDTGVKRKKKLKSSVKQEKPQSNIVSTETVNDISSTSTVGLATTFKTIPFETLSSPRVSSLLTSTISSLDQPKSCPSLVSPLSSLPADSASLVTICTPSLSMDVLQPFVSPQKTKPSLSAFSPEYITNRNPMLLPIKQPKEDYKPMVNQMAASEICHNRDNLTPTVVCSLNQEVDKVVGSGMESRTLLEDVYFVEKHKIINDAAPDGEAKYRFIQNPTFENKQGQANNSTDHCKAKLSDTEYLTNSEACSSYRQSPVDFEIEVGEEDLPETALSLLPILPAFQQIMDDELYQNNNLKTAHLSSLRRRHSTFSRPVTNRTQQSEQEQQLYLKEHHTADIRSHKKGSVANYLSQKFLFSGAGHKIKGPRLLYMPANRKAGTREVSKQETKKQSICETNTLCEDNTLSEPITSPELSKTPSVVEIFGASVGKETANTGIKMDSVEVCASHIPINSNSCISTDKTKVSAPLCQGRLTIKRISNKKKRKNDSSMSNDSSHSAVSTRPNISARPMAESHSTRHQLSHGVKRGDLHHELVSRMRLCKVVLTKLDIGDVDKLSENMFIIKKEATEMNERPSENEMEKHPDSNFKTYRKVPVVKKKRKKAYKVTKRPVLKPKRDIVDYYAFMLENLQKKAQQLEEESRRKAEDNSKRSLDENSEYQEMNERNQSTYDANYTETEEYCEVLKLMKNNEETVETEDEIVQKHCSTSKETETADKLQVAICSKDNFAPYADNETAINTMKTTDDTIDEKGRGESSLECESSVEKLEYHKANGVSLANNAESLKKCDFVVQNEISDVSDSNLPFLLKFCDETIFNQGSTDYLQKISEGVCFPKINSSSVSEQRFDKKDTVLGSSVTGEAGHTGAQNASETLHETEENTAGCMDECSDEQVRVNMDDNEMLLDLEIQQNSTFNQDDNTSRIPFSSEADSQIKLVHSDTDKEGGTASKIRSEEVSPQDTIVKVSTVVEDTLSSSGFDRVSCHAELIDNKVITDPLNDKPLICTGMSKAFDHRTVTVRNAEVSPSWERLLGHKSLDIGQLSCDGNFISNPEEPATHSVSFVASSNFKFKFKLPQGILSKAIKMSRDMKTVFEEPVSQDSSLSSQEVSVDHNIKNNATTHNVSSLTSREVSDNGSVDETIKNNTTTHNVSSLSSQEVSDNSSVDETIKNNATTHNVSSLTSREVSDNSSVDETIKNNATTHNVSSLSSREVSDNSSVDETIKNNTTTHNVSSLSSREVSDNGSVDETIRNNATTHNFHSESQMKDNLAAFAAEQISNSQMTPFMSQLSGPELTFSSVTLPDTKKAKANFLHRKKGKRKSKRSFKVKNKSTSLPAKFDNHIPLDTDITLEKSERDEYLIVPLDRPGDPYQELKAGNVKRDSEQMKLFAARLNCDTNLKEGNRLEGGTLCSLDSTELKQVIEGSAIQANNVSIPESVFHVNKTPAKNAVCLKQSRKDGIFSNIDFFQGLADEPVAKHAAEPYTSRQETDLNILKTNVIDIGKLRLKLNPLISSKLKERAAQACVDVHQEDSNCVLKGKKLPHSDPEHMQVGHTSSEMLKVESHECDLPVTLNVAQCASVKLLTNSSTESQPISSSTQSSHHILIPTCKPIPQVNAAKLCSILKNFHKKASISSYSPTNSEGLSPDVSLYNSRDNRLSAVNCSPSVVFPVEKPIQLGTLVNNSKMGIHVKVRRGGRTSRVVRVPQINKVKVGREMRKVIAASPVKVTHHGQSIAEDEDNVGDNNKCKNEEKGERSFFDCLSSVPLDVWEEK